MRPGADGADQPGVLGGERGGVAFAAVAEIETGQAGARGRFRRRNEGVARPDLLREIFEDLVEFVRKKKPGEEVTVEVRRGDEMLKLKLVVGKRPS